jgi:hypothetical protein
VLSSAAEALLCRARAAKLQPWIGTDDRVLEFGVGFGWNLALLKCVEKVGYDPVVKLREAVEAKGIRFEGQVERLQAETFDVALAHHVLEHVQSARQCLELLRTLIEDTGQLLIYIPFERETKYHRLNSRDRAHHLSSWTPSSLSHLLNSTGWSVQNVGLETFRFDRLAAIICAKLRFGMFGYRWLRLTACQLFPEFELFARARPRS